VKLLILSASGQTGRILTELAAENGHDVHALVRSAPLNHFLNCSNWEESE